MILNRLNALKDGFSLKKITVKERVLFHYDLGIGADGEKVTDESEFL